MYSNGHVVAVQVNGKTVNDSNGKVLLPFGVEYSLMLKNRNDRKVVARVYIDGEEVTKSGRLILDANSSLNLERYVEDMNNGARFKFVPLANDKVKDKGDSEKGYVEVRFQLVKPTQSQVIYHEEHIYHNHHHFNDYWTYPIYKGPYYIGDPVWCSTNGDPVWCSTNGGCGGTCTSNSSNNMTSISCSVGGSLNEANVEKQYFAKIEDNHLIEEAGATIKGSNSDQKFSYSYVGELEAQETVIRFQLVGTSDKEIALQYTKTHCNQCGKRYETNDNFCSKCGTKK